MRNCLLELKPNPLKHANKHQRSMGSFSLWRLPGSFAWGNIPAYVPNLSDFNAENTEQARDISVVIPTEQFNVVLPASFCPISTAESTTDPPQPEKALQCQTTTLIWTTPSQGRPTKHISSTSLLWHVALSWLVVVCLLPRCTCWVQTTTVLPLPFQSNAKLA